MTNRPAQYTQADVTRLIKGALGAGIEKENIAGVRTTKDGIVLLISTKTISGEKLNEWDEVLDGSA